LINSYIDPYCNTAFNYGWLRKFMKYYHYWYKCPKYYDDPCWCKKNDDGWVLDHIEYKWVEEVYPN
jgi:hypothetical protein